jgi:hypothetical protein
LLYGMQEVSGSTPLSSTHKALNHIGLGLFLLGLIWC